MLELGKYAAPVLLSYGVALVMMGGLIWLSIARQRRIRKQIRALQEGRK